MPELKPRDTPTTRKPDRNPMFAPLCFRVFCVFRGSHPGDPCHLNRRGEGWETSVSCAESSDDDLGGIIGSTTRADMSYFCGLTDKD
jgi:hypothetical protein